LLKLVRCGAVRQAALFRPRLAGNFGLVDRGLRHARPLLQHQCCVGGTCSRRPGSHHSNLGVPPREVTLHATVRTICQRVKLCAIECGTCQKDRNHPHIVVLYTVWRNCTHRLCGESSQAAGLETGPWDHRYRETHWQPKMMLSMALFVLIAFVVRDILPALVMLGLAI
jgi:hypothetical protein